MQPDILVPPGSERRSVDKRERVTHSQIELGLRDRSIVQQIGMREGQRE